LAKIRSVWAILSVGAAPVGAGFANGKTLQNKFYFFPKCLIFPATSSLTF
jgi:hypothetical protein